MNFIKNNYHIFKIYPHHSFIPTNPNSDNAQMYGGLASTITGGNFLEGGAIGLDVTALNHALHAALDPDPTQQQKGNEKMVKNENKSNGVEITNWDKNGDGKLQTDEAKVVWQRKNANHNDYINIDFNKVDLGDITYDDFNDVSVGNTKPINLIFRNSSDGTVYGNLTFKNEGNYLICSSGDKYNFDYKKGWQTNLSTSARNILNFAGKLYNGKGTEFKINFYNNKRFIYPKFNQ